METDDKREAVQRAVDQYRGTLFRAEVLEEVARKMRDAARIVLTSEASKILGWPAAVDFEPVDGGAVEIDGVIYDPTPLPVFLV